MEAVCRNCIVLQRKSDSLNLKRHDGQVNLHLLTLVINYGNPGDILLSRTILTGNLEALNGFTLIFALSLNDNIIKKSTKGNDTLSKN